MTNGINRVHKDVVTRALVVFSGQTDLAWLRIFRPGFRHCFVVIEWPVEDARSDWVLYNPLSNATQINIWQDVGCDALCSCLTEQGYKVVKTHVRPLRHRVLPWRPYTCVEAVKRALGLHKNGIFTPWQLYKFLKKDNKMKIFLDISEHLGY